MFIAALSTMAKVSKEPECPSMDEWIKKMWCVCVCVCVPFAATWMELEGMMLSEISKRKTKIIRLHSYEDFKRQNR